MYKQASLPAQVDDEMYLNIQLCLAHANRHAGHFRMSRLPNMNWTIIISRKLLPVLIYRHMFKCYDL